MKRYKEIIQSMTEPSTSSLWLYSGTLKQFGKSGWETIGSEGIDKGYITGTSISKIEVVSELPESPDSTTLYLVVSDE